VSAAADAATDLDAAAFLVAILALVLSGVALYYSRRATRASEQQALAAMTATAVAEREEQRQLADAEARAVRWTVSVVGTAAIRLTNVGEQAAHDVRVELPSGGQLAGRPLPAGQTVPAGSSLVVGVAVQYAAAVQVFWALSPSGRETEQTYPID
jgi:type II secretory pathway pseudopilin PulG